jgi:RNA polymerase sigma-70 factor (ECF subfamily)
MQVRPKLVSVPMQPDADIPDDALVERARRGDRVALGMLVRRHQRSLFALCLRYVGDVDEAQDLVQRTFVRAMTKLPELREVGAFRGWLLRIGAHLALNHLRDNARFVSEDTVAAGGLIDQVQHTEARVVDWLEAAETGAVLRDAVKALPTKQRMTLELRVYEELAFRDIAAALGTSEGAAKVNFHYAVRRLRVLLAPAGDPAQRPGQRGDKGTKR